MKNKLLLLSFFFFCLGWKGNDTVAPQHSISNKLIAAALYLPDATNGYYQATRFDWSGIISSLKYKGHSFFGLWFEKYSPKINDAITGPVESFGPLGYDEASDEGNFVMIGVGALKKPSGKIYSPFALYEITNYGKWRVKKKADLVEFIHILDDASGYSYVYSKTVKLIKGQPKMVLEHSLKNTGTKTIETEVYNHNFPVIDKEPTGPGMKVLFPFEVKAEGRGFGTLAETKGKEIVFNRMLEKKETVFCSGLSGFNNTSADYDIRIQNEKTGAGMHITGDMPLKKMVFWASATTVCPEPYIALKVTPGQTIKWKINYEFYTFSPSN